MLRLWLVWAFTLNFDGVRKRLFYPYLYIIFPIFPTFFIFHSSPPPTIKASYMHRLILKWNHEKFDDFDWSRWRANPMPQAHCRHGERCDPSWSNGKGGDLLSQHCQGHTDPADWLLLHGNDRAFRQQGAGKELSK